MVTYKNISGYSVNYTTNNGIFNDSRLYAVAAFVEDGSAFCDVFCSHSHLKILIFCLKRQPKTLRKPIF